MSSVPADVYLEILLRLPAKSIYTCKSVCKTWYSLISNPNFKLRRQTNNNLLMLRGSRGHKDVIYSTGYDSLASCLISVEIDYPYKSLGNINLVGSCNGLVCFWNAYWEFFCIWNPATKEYKKLPKSPYKCDARVVPSFKGDIGLYAFGYDRKNDDYKLIYVVELSYGSPKEESCSSVYVYTFRSNSWRIRQTVPYKFRCSRFKQCNGVLVNGALHWVARKRCDANSRLIVSLDFKSKHEEFKEVPLTEELWEKKNFSIGVLEECLCAIVDVGVGYQVWIMQEYGVRESWNKCYVISSDKIKNNYYFKVLCSLQNSEILLSSGENLVLYDTEDGSARELNMNGVKYFCDKVNYFESLVSLDSNTYVGVHDEQEIKNKKSQMMSHKNNFKRV